MYLEMPCLVISLVPPGKENSVGQKGLYLQASANIILHAHFATYSFVKFSKTVEQKTSAHPPHCHSPQ